jgi:hypothetical protein
LKGRFRILNGLVSVANTSSITQTALNLLKSGMKANVWTTYRTALENITTLKMDNSGTMVTSRMADLTDLGNLQMRQRPTEYCYSMKESGETVSNMDWAHITMIKTIYLKGDGTWILRLRGLLLILTAVSNKFSLLFQTLKRARSMI